MGNVPNRSAGLGAAVAVALLAAVAAFALGDAAADRAANGFTFDWYRHPAEASFGMGETITHAAVAAGVAALAGVLVVVPLAAGVMRLWMRRTRFVPPRIREAAGLDTHAGRLLATLPVLAALATLLVAYLVLVSPMLQTDAATGARMPPVERVSGAAYEAFVAWGAALGGAAAGFVAFATTFRGAVSGRLTKDPASNVLGRVSLFGVRNAKTAVALVVVATMVAGYYATTLTTNVDVADVLPRGDPNTVAAKNLTEKFKSSFTQQVTFQFHVLDTQNVTQQRIYAEDNANKLPFRNTDEKPDNITDELYVRAMAQVIDYVLARGEFAGEVDTPFVGSIGGPDMYRLINWTIAGGHTDQNTAGAASFSLPDTSREGEMRYRSVDEGVNRVGAVYSALDAVSSPNWTQMSFLVTVHPNADISTREIGERALALRDDWVRYAETHPAVYQVFGPANPPMFTVDLPIANAHASELTKHDFTFLLPIIGVFIAVTLFIAFRNAVSVAVTFSMLAIAVTWTFGVMGAMGIALNTINLATVPLIMGVGIDYGIHMMNEFQEHRARGETPEESWTAAGRGSALALFVGMLTTAAGLVVMMVSPSLLVAQLGLLALVALVSCYVLAVLFIPALTTILGRTVKGRTQFHPSTLMPAFATGVSRVRWGAVVVLLIVAVAAVASATGIRREAFGDPPRNWLPDDPLRQEHERALAGFYERATDDVKANVIIFEGDITTPEAHAYIDSVTRTLRAYSVNGTYVGLDGEEHDSRVISDTLRDLPFLMRTYLTVRGGATGYAQYAGAPALQQLFEQAGFDDPTTTSQTYPQTQEEIQAVLDEVFESPLHELANLFIDPPDYQMAVTIFSVEAATYEDAELVWNEVQSALRDNEALKPEGMQVSFFGNTAINYLFVAKQVPWLGYMSIATAIAVTVIVFALTRDVRSTIVVAALNVLTTAFWLGALSLPFIDIGLAISLTLPLIFIYAMGSDYGLHLSMRCRKEKDTYRAFASVGKGVMFSFATTFGAFLVFTQVSDLAARRSMIATAIAIGVTFLATLVIVPILFPVKKGQAPDASRHVPVVEGAPTPETTVEARVK